MIGRGFGRPSLPTAPAESRRGLGVRMGPAKTDRPRRDGNRTLPTVGTIRGPVRQAFGGRPRPGPVFRPWRSFPTMVGAGLVLGLVTGGFPSGAREISQAALVIATTFALTEISFVGLSPRTEFRSVLLALSLSYVVLSGLVLVYASLAVEPALHDGWVLMAAVPPAVAVVPITSYLRGDTRGTTIALAFLYLLGLALVPGITFAFTRQGVPVEDLLLQTGLLIGIPLLASRPLRHWPLLQGLRPTAVSVSFFVLVTAIVGSTRATLLSRPDLLIPLSFLSFGRTFGLGVVVFGLSRVVRARRDGRIAATTFASFKNLGLTIVLAFAVFGPTATLPSVVSLVFEIGWLATLPWLFRDRHADREAGSI